MKFSYGGETYRLVFRHEDFRFAEKVVDAEGKVHWVPNHPKVIRRNGQARTYASLERMTNPGTETTGPEWEVLASYMVRCSPKDVFNRAHGRWYATEGLILEVQKGGENPWILERLLHRDSRFHRAIRKALYDGTTWRPDGRDGYRISKAYTIPQLERVAG